MCFVNHSFVAVYIGAQTLLRTLCINPSDFVLGMSRAIFAETLRGEPRSLWILGFIIKHLFILPTSREIYLFETR